MSEPEIPTAAETAPETAAEGARPRRLTLNMGPQHPSTHGVLRLILELEGETIRKADLDLSLIHI